MTETKTIQTLYEDENLIAVNKPAGIIVHPDGKGRHEALTDILVKNYPELKAVGGVVDLASGGQTARHGVLHRIDRETSGIVLVAKNPEAFSFFQKQFIDRTVKKNYYAFVMGEVSKSEGDISLPIGRSRKDFRKWATDSKARGTLREAETHFQKTLSAQGFSFLQIEPKTGRTHQIRVHLSSIGHPIICDKLYGAKTPCALGFKRLALHAESVSLKLLDGRIINIKAPFPPDFQSAIEQIAVKLD